MPRGPLASHIKPKTLDVVHDEPDAQIKVHKKEYSDLCNICWPKIQRQRRISAFHKSFVDFGYTTATREDVTAAYDIAIVREPVAEDTIFVRLIRSQLKEGGIVE